MPIFRNAAMHRSRFFPFLEASSFCSWMFDQRLMILK